MHLLVAADGLIFIGVTFPCARGPTDRLNAGRAAQGPRSVPDRLTPETRNVHLYVHR